MARDKIAARIAACSQADKEQGGIWDRTGVRGRGDLRRGPGAAQESVKADLVMTVGVHVVVGERAAARARAVDR